MSDVAKKKVSVKFYQTANGTEPTKSWLLRLSKLDRKLIGADIKTIEYGWPIGMPVCRSMKDGLYEVRTKLDSRRSARVLFCFHDDLMILLHGFIKKSQKTPQSDLSLARSRKKEVENG
ncbi:type II toxin-antitoxin system RelE/ParE family toxin [Pseudidiomarina sp.]|uniref:type II toxin-antitoxin system RelE/ParE family toxin n=1 Tax=Pseudidiomarina sp. TaxID=2081707 RepID=UPI003A9862D6